MSGAGLPRRPWAIHVYCSCGDTNYQVQASDGQVIANFMDSDFDAPGAAAATAYFIAESANRSAGIREPMLVDGDRCSGLAAMRKRAGYIDKTPHRAGKGGGS